MASPASPRPWRWKPRTFGITANAICPGYVWTPLVEKQIPDTMAARGLTREQVINDVLLAAQPTKQFVTVEEIAALALYLAGDMARSITGASFRSMADGPPLKAAPTQFATSRLNLAANGSCAIQGERPNLCVINARIGDFHETHTSHCRRPDAVGGTDQRRFCPGLDRHDDHRGNNMMMDRHDDHRGNAMMMRGPHHDWRKGGRIERSDWDRGARIND